MQWENKLYNYLKKKYFRRWRVLAWADAAAIKKLGRRRFTKIKFFRKKKRKKARKIRILSYFFIYYKEFFFANFSIVDRLIRFRRKKKKKKKFRLRLRTARRLRRWYKSFGKIARSMPFDLKHLVRKKRKRVYTTKFLTREGMKDQIYKRILEWRNTGRRRAARKRQNTNIKTIDTSQKIKKN